MFIVPILSELITFAINIRFQRLIFVLRLFFILTSIVEIEKVKVEKSRSHNLKDRYCPEL